MKKNEKAVLGIYMVVMAALVFFSIWSLLRATGRLPYQKEATERALKCAEESAKVIKEQYRQRQEMEQRWLQDRLREMRNDSVQ